MKKGTSFYLEEDILNEIEIYKKENGLNSKNTALERLILDYKNIKKELEYMRTLVDYTNRLMNGNIPSNIPNTTPKPDITINEDKKKSIKMRSIKNSYDTMD